jgi:hypothetical protein
MRNTRAAPGSALPSAIPRAQYRITADASGKASALWQQCKSQLGGCKHGWIQQSPEWRGGSQGFTKLRTRLYRYTGQ